MNQHQFEQSSQDYWERFEKLLTLLENKPDAKKRTEISQQDFPGLYRQLCNHYGLAQARHYSPALVDRLHDLVSRGHRQLYQTRPGLIWAFITFIARDFPVAVRRHHAAFWLAFCLFCGPALVIGIATFSDSTMIYSLMDESQVIEMENMYDQGNKKMGRPADRDSETDFVMFGYYIFNNISIGFKTFASGIIFGAGSLLLLVFNGLMIGGVAGHLSHPPYNEYFWQFVPGHGAFELTAIVICGAAGLLLGYSLICPGSYTRTDSLRIMAPKALQLVIGAALMLFIAAFVEAFWSSSALPAKIKYSVAAVNWTAVILYLSLVGRSGNES